MKTSHKKLAVRIGFGIAMPTMGALVLLAWLQLFHLLPIGPNTEAIVVVGLTAICVAGAYIAFIGGGHILVRRKFYGR